MTSGIILLFVTSFLNPLSGEKICSEVIVRITSEKTVKVIIQSVVTPSLKRCIQHAHVSALHAPTLDVTSDYRNALHIHFFNVSLPSSHSIRGPTA